MPALRTRDTTTLEVSTTTTEGLQPPTLAIISPTPRAFTFPIAHNLIDSRGSSPSHSPFEPDLGALALCSTPSPSPACASASAPTSPHRRRKSCSSDAGERRPKKGDDDYIKRPENAFILFRRKCCEERQAALDDARTGTCADGPAKKQRQADLSKTISQLWKGLSGEERQYWEDLARARKKEHEEKYPHYVYRPQRARDRDGRPKPRRPRRKGSDDSDTDSLAFLVPVRHHARSASAPTPPPYQSVHVPSVYHMPPSCPASPSLLPMISRRQSPDPVVPLPFDFDPASDFLQGMFSMAGLAPATESLHIPDALHLSPDSSAPSSPTTALDYLHIDMQLQQEFAQLAWDPTAWDPLLATNDFDIAAIPPVQLDLPKCDDPQPQPQPHPQDFFDPSLGIIPFDQLF